MSEKMKKFLNKKRVEKPVQQIVENRTIDCMKTYNNILSESVSILPSDREIIYHAIEHSSNGSYTLNSYKDVFDISDRTVVVSRKSGTMVSVAYNSELVEVTDFIINFCDKMGYKFQTMDHTNPELTTFTIFVR